MVREREHVPSARPRLPSDERSPRKALTSQGPLFRVTVKGPEETQEGTGSLTFCLLSPNSARTGRSAATVNRLASRQPGDLRRQSRHLTPTPHRPHKLGSESERWPVRRRPPGRSLGLARRGEQGGGALAQGGACDAASRRALRICHYFICQPYLSRAGERCSDTRPLSSCILLQIIKYDTWVIKKTQQYAEL